MNRSHFRNFLERILFSQHLVIGMFGVFAIVGGFLGFLAGGAHPVVIFSGALWGLFVALVYRLEATRFSRLLRSLGLGVIGALLFTFTCAIVPAFVNITVWGHIFIGFAIGITSSLWASYIS